MTPEQLAPILYTREVEYCGITATPWECLHESHRRKWYALAKAALTALRGPRTGEEVHNAFQAALAANGVPGTPYSWDLVKPDVRRALIAVAATFATPKPPEGWPEGYRLLNCTQSVSGAYVAIVVTTDADRMCVFHVWGATHEEAATRARLCAHTLATVTPVQTDMNDEIERLKTALRAETNAHIETKNALAIARRDEQRAHERWRRVEAVAMDLAGELADVRLAELTDRIRGAGE